MSALSGMIAAIADERRRRDLDGGTRRRGDPAPDYVPNVDAGQAKGDAATIMSTTVGNQVVYASRAGTNGWQLLTVDQPYAVRAADNSTNTVLGKSPVTGGGVYPDPAMPTYTNVPASQLLAPGPYTIEQIEQALGNVS